MPYYTKISATGSPFTNAPEGSSELLSVHASGSAIITIGTTSIILPSGQVMRLGLAQLDLVGVTVFSGEVSLWTEPPKRHMRMLGRWVGTMPAGGAAAGGGSGGTKPAPAPL